MVRVTPNSVRLVIDANRTAQNAEPVIRKLLGEGLLELHDSDSQLTLRVDEKDGKARAKLNLTLVNTMRELQLPAKAISVRLPQADETRLVAALTPLVQKAFAERGLSLASSEVTRITSSGCVQVAGPQAMSQNDFVAIELRVRALLAECDDEAFLQANVEWRASPRALANARGRVVTPGRPLQGAQRTRRARGLEELDGDTFR